ncbi:MAG: YitT family protein [Clostridia bacterium]|nr:YitT family protein [Clostridia bacterium]
MAVAVSLFLLPNELSSGGFSGIATILYYLFKIPLGITIIILNIPLFVTATLKIGKSFIIKSIIGTICLSIFIDLLEKISPLTNDKILACVYGGILSGLGTALILRAHSSTRWLRYFKLNNKRI